MALRGTRPIWQSVVLQDDTYTHRWHDAVGPGVCKVLEEFVQTPYTAASTIGSTTTTLVGASTHALVAGALGGDMLITTAGAEDDGAQIQWLGEAFLPTATNRCYFGVSFQVSDATQSDFLFGLCITDTTALGAVTDGIYFRKIDGVTQCNFVVETASTETETAAVVQIAAATDYILEWTWNRTALEFYVNGVLIGAPVLTNIPTVEYMTPTIAFLTGEAAVKTLTVHWMRCIQVPDLS